MGRIIDAIHDDKIADKLIQFMSKLPKTEDLCESQAIYSVHFMNSTIERMLKHVDVMAKMDEAGWLR